MARFLPLICQMWNSVTVEKQWRFFEKKKARKKPVIMLEQEFTVEVSSFFFVLILQTKVFILNVFLYFSKAHETLFKIDHVSP